LNAVLVEKSARRFCHQNMGSMHGEALDVFREGLRRFLAEGGYAWVERPGPPPHGVKILKNAHPPRIAERLCEEGFPLVYIAAVRRRDSSTPLEEACRRGEAVCYVYGDVEWAPELEGRCRPVTFYVDVREEKKALEALLLYIARTRSLPWVAFNRDVLKVVGLCDVEPNACLTEEAVAKKVETIKKQLAARRPEPPRSSTAEAAGDGAGPGDTAETQSDAPPQARPAQDAGRVGPAEARRVAARLDPAVLELLRRCCREECVSRLLACHE
jgi:hypothetical protein